MSYQKINEQASYHCLSDTELLQKLIGIRQTQKHFRGSLGALFAAEHNQVLLPENASWRVNWSDDGWKRYSGGIAY
ncbi:MAG: hypothetical protein WDM70_08260 [Nitrosomonadales bacterium]